MNSTRFSAALISLVGLAGLAAGCDGNDETNPTDTRVDTGSPDTGGGDSTADSTEDTTPDIVVTAGTVKAAQVEATAVTCDPQGFVDVNPASALNGVIVTTPKFDASADEDGTIDGYYVADRDGGAYSGILLRIPAANRPAADLAPGDIVDVTGQLKEVFCWTQLEVATVTKTSAVEAPAPLVVGNPGDLANEAYESMLVRINDVVVQKASAAGGWKATPGDIEIGFAFPGFIGLAEGSTYDITGVIRLSFGKYQLVPRGPSDVVLKSTTTSGITDIQGAAISTSCPNPDQQFVNGQAGLSFSGTVLVGNHYVTGSLDGYYITDGTQNPYSAVLVTVSNSPKTAFVPGDVVSVTGDHQEFYCNTQIRASALTKTGGPSDVPAPVVLQKNPGDAELEKYEGMLVEMAGVAASTYDADKRQVGTDAGVGIDFGIMGPDAFAEGAAFVGKTVTVRGVVRFSRGTYRIQPRSADDVVAQ